MNESSSKIASQTEFSHSPNNKQKVINLFGVCAFSKKNSWLMSNYLTIFRKYLPQTPAFIFMGIMHNNSGNLCLCLIQNKRVFSIFSVLVYLSKKLDLQIYATLTKGTKLSKLNLLS